MQSEYELFSHRSLAIFGLPFYLGGGGGLTNNHLITFSYHIPIPTPLFGDTCLTVAVKGTGTVSSQIAFLVAIVERFVLFVYGLCVFAVSAFPKSGDWDIGVLVHFLQSALPVHTSIICDYHFLVNDSRMLVSSSAVLLEHIVSLADSLSYEKKFHRVLPYCSFIYMCI